MRIRRAAFAWLALALGLCGGPLTPALAQTQIPASKVKIDALAKTLEQAAAAGQIPQPCTIAAGALRVFTEGGTCGQAAPGALVTITDAANKSDCGPSGNPAGSAGGGTVPNVCQYRSSTAKLEPFGGAGGAGDVTGGATSTADDVAVYSATGGKTIGNSASGTVRIRPHATAGAGLTIPEGADDGSNTWTLKAPDSGLSATVSNTLTAAGLVPATALDQTSIAAGTAAALAATGATFLGHVDGNQKNITNVAAIITGSMIYDTASSTCDPSLVGTNNCRLQILGEPHTPDNSDPNSISLYNWLVGAIGLVVFDENGFVGAVMLSGASPSTVNAIPRTLDGDSTRFGPTNVLIDDSNNVLGAANLALRPIIVPFGTLTVPAANFNSNDNVTITTHGLAEGAGPFRVKEIRAVTLASTSFSTSTDLVTMTTTGLAENQGPFRFTTAGTALPAPLATGTDYFLKGLTATATGFSLTAGGSLINLTSNGTSGNHYLNWGTELVAGTADATADTIAFPADHNLAEGTGPYRIYAAAPPGGLNNTTDYYIKTVTATNTKLALTSGGTAINITSTGTPPILLLGGNNLPQGMRYGTSYYVSWIDANTIKLRVGSSTGATLNILTTGVGANVALEAVAPEASQVAVFADTTGIQLNARNTSATVRSNKFVAGGGASAPQKLDTGFVFEQVIGVVSPPQTEFSWKLANDDRVPVLVNWRGSAFGIARPHYYAVDITLVADVGNDCASGDCACSNEGGTCLADSVRDWGTAAINNTIVYTRRDCATDVADTRLFTVACLIPGIQ